MPSYSPVTPRPVDRRRGMGVKTISVKLPWDLYEELVDMVDIRELSLSEYVREAIREKISRELGLKEKLLERKKLREKWGVIVIGSS
jgi:metal-responsive CopG/Arc/MetJ family transcriptional regulator